MPEKGSSWVGTDKSATHPSRSNRSPYEVATEAEAGRTTCRFSWVASDMLRTAEKLGLFTR